MVLQLLEQQDQLQEPLLLAVVVALGAVSWATASSRVLILFYLSLGVVAGRAILSSASNSGKAHKKEKKAVRKKSRKSLKIVDPAESAEPEPVEPVEPIGPAEAVQGEVVRRSHTHDISRRRQSELRRRRRAEVQSLLRRVEAEAARAAAAAAALPSPVLSAASLASPVRSRRGVFVSASNRASPVAASPPPDALPDALPDADAPLFGASPTHSELGLPLLREQQLEDINTLPADMNALLAELDQALAASSEDDDDRESFDNDENPKELILADHVADCKNLVTLLYSISEDQARRDGFVHRGVTCNHCGAQPIRGIRYHCLNCADYDLCDSCESLGDVHVKTHCFIKIRVPLAPHANLRGAGAPVMYPGKEITSGWNKDDLMTSLLESKLCHFELIELQALFEQFLALATVPPTDTEPGGITRETFDLCLGPLGKEKNLITDRIFSFFDQDSDNIISFKEFVLGLGVMIKGSLDERISYAFKGYDIDSDGRISRQELHRMFKAYFYLSMQLVRDYVKTVEQDMMDTFDDEAAKPVSASFTAPIPSSGGSADDEDQSHTKIRGYEGTISGSSRPNTAPSSSADVAAVFSSAGANSDSSPSFTESSPLVQATQTSSSSSSSTSLPRPASSNIARSSSINNPSSTNTPPSLTIDVNSKSMKGKLPHTIHENQDTTTRHNRLPSPTSATSAGHPRRSGSPVSIISNRSASPTYTTPTATQFPNSARLSGTISTTTTTTTVVGGLLTRGTRALQEVQAMRRRSNVSLRSVYRDGSTSSTYANGGFPPEGSLPSPVSPFEEFLWGSAGTVAGGGSNVLLGASDEQQLPVIEAMSQDAIEEMVERTFTAADAADPNYITLDEFKRAVELDHSYLQWFEALGSVF